ncbi:MAG: phage tail tape measure protein [Oliverpabstia sp.]
MTGVVTAAGTAAVKTAADFEASMSKVSAVSGATGADLDALSAKAREMGSKTKFSASEAAEAMNYMAMAGWKTEDMLSGIEGVMNLAAASSNANTNVSMMGETFKYCAPIAGSLGFSVEDTAEAIGLMANAGIKSTQAGTSLRTVMTSLSGDVKICGSAIGEVTVATANADGSMRDLSDILADCRAAFAGLTESEKAAVAESQVGKNAMSGFLALMDAGEGDINKLSGAINDCDGAAQKMEDTMNDNLEGQLTILKSALEELAISFGQLLIPALKDVVQWLQGIVGFLNSLPEGVKKTIVVIAMAAAALGPILIVVGKVISSIGTIMTIIPKLAGVIGTVQKAFAALHVTMLSNPIALIIAAISALVAAFIYLWNTNEEFRKFWISLWEDMKRVAVEVWDGISRFMSQAWESIRQTAVTVWNGMKQTITTVITGIRDTISRVWNSIKSTVTSVVNALKSAVGGAFTSMWDGIRSTVSGIYDTIKSGFSQAVSYVTGLASNAFQWGSDLINGIVNGIRNAIGNPMPTDAFICQLMYKDESRKALILREICEKERILEMIKVLFICHGM